MLIPLYLSSAEEPLSRCSLVGNWTEERWSTPILFTQIPVERTCTDAWGMETVCSYTPSHHLIYKSEENCAGRWRTFWSLEQLEVNYSANRDMEAFNTGYNVPEKQAHQRGCCCHHSDEVRQVPGELGAVGSCGRVWTKLPMDLVKVKTCVQAEITAFYELSQNNACIF